MYVSNNTKDYDNISSSNYTDYDNVTSSNDKKTLSNCTNKENNFDINIPTLIITIQCGLSFLCLMSLMVYTLMKPLFSNK